MQGSSARKIALPVIDRVRLDHFDLYSRQSDLDVRVERPVFCLIGANGLGKSTFLNTVNYTITGAIPDPDRRFQSAADYLKDATRADRAEDYFSGRLSGSAWSVASATVTLSWPRKEVEITRELLGGAGVTRMLVRNLADGSERVEVNGGAGLEESYRSVILAETGLEDFAQFVFLMHFVSTFDEGRHLLMWDDAALTNALYLAFGADPAIARETDRLQREMDRESSRGRNVRFSARHVAERMKQLHELLAQEPAADHVRKADLKASHDRLTGQLAEARERTGRKRTELRAADADWVELSARLTEAQVRYRRLFSDRLQNTTSVSYHPLVRTTIGEDRCAVCGTAHVGGHVHAKVDTGQCPLCDTSISTAVEDEGVVTELKDLDVRMADLRERLGAALAARERLSDQLVAAEKREEACTAELSAFESEEGANLAAASVDGDFSAIRREIERLEREQQAFITQSKAHYQRRDELRAELRRYEKQLRQRYEAASETFVPRFRELAEAFIGLPIDVSLEQRQSANEAGFGLRMRMADQLRLQPEDVSESQRFFIDIALRMALAEFMASGAATLLVDTPEGSLDIAYEARAGVMLSSFARAGNRLLMTANLRSSQLVLRLADLEKSAGMQIVRMTDWTDLSEVQQTEEGLFVKAYDEIEAALA